MNQIQTLEQTKELSAQELVFSRLVASGYSLTQAYKKAFPDSELLKVETIRNNASKLMMNNGIALEVSSTKQRQSLLVRLAEDQLEGTLTEGKNNKTTNDVAMFMYEQGNGKATQKTVIEGKHVLVTYDLSGGKAGAVPQEILDQLAD